MIWYQLSNLELHESKFPKQNSQLQISNNLSRSLYFHSRFQKICDQFPYPLHHLILAVLEIQSLTNLQYLSRLRKYTKNDFDQGQDHSNDHGPNHDHRHNNDHDHNHNHDYDGNLNIWPLTSSQNNNKRKSDNNNKYKHESL